MGLEAEVVSSGSPESAEVYADSPHGKSSLDETPFNSTRPAFSNSSTPF